MEFITSALLLFMNVKAGISIPDDFAWLRRKRPAPKH